MGHRATVDGQGADQICVSAIRRTLVAGGRPGSVVPRAPGHSIRCVDRELDLLAFEYLVASARRGLARNRLDDAAGAFRDALRLWRGTVPPAGVRSHLLQSTGAQLVEPLYRTERKAEALQTYRSGRRMFVEELGLEPGVEPRRLEWAILADQVGDVLTPAGVARPVPVRTGVPRLLPADIGDFAGRRDLIERARRALCGPREAGSRAMPLVVLAGPPRLGVTSRTRLVTLGGATTLDIGPLDEWEAVELLAEAIGRERVAAESGNIAGWLTCARVSRWGCGWPSAG